MAQAARNALVRALQVEGRMTAVVEFRRPPAHNGVASRTTFFVSSGLELASVHIGVAAGAVLGRAAEGDGAGAILGRGLMARQAVHGRVPAE